MTEPRRPDVDDLDPHAALDHADRLRETVRRRSARWYVRYLVLIGIAILAVFPLYALPPPWVWVAFGPVWGAGVVFFWFYERGQRIQRRRSQRRVAGAFIGYFVLAAAVLGFGGWLYDDLPAWWFPVFGAVFSLPFFVAAYLEHRAAGDEPGGAGR